MVLFPLQNTHIPGLLAIMARFEAIKDNIRSKPYDLLDFRKTQFDRDFMEFNVNINDLETDLQVICSFDCGCQQSLPTTIMPLQCE